MPQQLRQVRSCMMEQASGWAHWTLPVTRPALDAAAALPHLAHLFGQVLLGWWLMHAAAATALYSEL